MKLSKIQHKEMSCLKQTNIKEIHISKEGLIPIDQLTNFIIDTVEDKSKSLSKFYSLHVNPYTQRVDNLKMFEGYQPPKFQQFDGK